MFTKDKEVRRGTFRVTKKVIDWEAVGGAAVVVFIVLALIGSFSG
ncbi:hypothetical protein [Woodsholea maritima]|nr:hypothetical protein [Woodsholea maritima]